LSKVKTVITIASVNPTTIVKNNSIVQWCKRLILFPMSLL